MSSAAVGRPIIRFTQENRGVQRLLGAGAGAGEAEIRDFNIGCCP